MNKLYKNEYLFSEIYLEEITNFEEKPEIISSLKTLKDYLEYSNKVSLSEWKNSFIQKVFGVLGFGYKSVTDNLIQLFVQGKTDKPISLCFTLLPTDDLDNATIGKHWSEKIIRNLRNEKLNWGILTNGSKWRIYHVDEPTPYENYIELDLQKILEAEDSKNYMIFFEFMKADNFVLGEESKCKFDEFKKDSYEKIEYIEEELKNALKQEQEDGKGVLADLCMGYVEFLKSKGKNNFKDEAFRKEIYSGAMLYMFRLLFVFYASARDLLTNEEIDAFHKLLRKSKNLFKSNKASRESYELWQELREIFGIIDVHYNGGLFDPLENKFIENNRVSDYFLCRVLYNMNFYEDEDGNEKVISYRDMGVRHLGTLYEGLLEHKLFLAEEDTEVKFVKGEIKFIPESDGGVIVEGKYIPKGQVYFGTDKYERKSTGSYFTPEYIVDYIVTNTVGEKLKELKEEFDSQNKELLEDIKIASDEKEKNVLIKELRDKTFEFTRKKILKLSVLDPAMGSGHFLVNAINQISNFITEFLNNINFVYEEVSSPIYWRRRVVENCIYGVDLNLLAVELAKLSLWILSMAKDAHLSFLNHHLKCGNSLQGTQLSDIGLYPGKIKLTKKSQISIWDKDIKFKETVEKVINDYLAIELRETINKDDIEYKKELLDEINDSLNPYKNVCDFHTSIYFGNDIEEHEYFATIKNPSSLKISNDLYFHWELEFPEIFRIYNGFDCVIGNPPYIDSETMVNTGLEPLRNYLAVKLNYTKGNWDIYIAFFEKGFILSREAGFSAFISPDKWISKPFGFELRKGLLHHLRIIAEFGRDVFDSAKVDSIITIIGKKKHSKLDIYRFIKDKPQKLISMQKSELKTPFAFDWLFSKYIYIIQTIESHPKRLIDYVECENACATSDAYKLKDFLIDIRPENFDENKYLKVINTGTIDKYLSKWGITKMTYLKDKYEAPVVKLFEFKKAFTNTYGKKSFVPKIIIKGLTLLDACIDTNGTIVPGKSTLVIQEKNDNKIDLLFLLGLLNTKLPLFYIKQKYSGSSYNQGINFNPDMINSIPMPKLEINTIKTIISLVRFILILKRNGKDYSILETILNFSVYEIFLKEAILPHNCELISNLNNLLSITNDLKENENIIIAEKIRKEFEGNHHPINKAITKMREIEIINIIETN